jgi:hypothetical protein
MPKAVYTSAQISKISALYRNKFISKLFKNPKKSSRSNLNSKTVDIASFLDVEYPSKVGRLETAKGIHLWVKAN